jgi:type II secretory ATPase GspE/PulE/Tfp pilus assembly ATPase PilB-like protein
VRKICLNCIESHAPAPAIAERFTQELRKNNNTTPAPKLVYSGKGCPTCNFSGYKGRTGLFELLLIDEGLRNIINSAHLTTDTIRKAAHEQGMLTILEDGLAKVERGVTTLEEVLRVTSE